MAINVAEYRRPGIFIKEIDQSIRSTPVQDTIINLVPGFSKKGPVNRPVLVSSPQELTDIFGGIDRNLESKGSYFHRTIQNILNQSPVWALNLLKTDDELDLLPWKSVSLSASTFNAVTLKDPYSRFFDRNEFWERDTEAFLNVAKSKSNIVDKVLHITNMSDKKITVYIFKSDLRGFDITAETWYEGRDKVPTWMYPTDLISDYLVKVLVVAGDWSDTATLSVDPRWSRYFSLAGLRKGTYRNFLNDPAVTVLKEYDLSLIPYFRDKNGTDLFIETVINRDTDTTGLFVSYDIDSLETETPNGLIDLIGHTLADKIVEKIEFVSYKESITESIAFAEIPLNAPGNVFGALLDYETKWVNDVVPTWTVTPSTPTNKVSVIELANTPSIVFSGKAVQLLATQTVSIPDVSNGRIRKDTVYVDQLGQISVVQGTEVSNLTNWNNVPLRAVPAFLYPIAIIEVGTSGSAGFLGVPSSASVLSLPNLVWSTSTTGDLLIEQTGGTLNQGQYEVTVTFNNTKTTDVDVNYTKFRLLQLFQFVQSNVLVGETIISGTVPTSSTPNTYVNTQVLSAVYVTNGAENKSVKFVTPNSFKIGKLTTNVTGEPAFAVYFENIEYSIGKFGLRTSSSTIPATNPEGDPTASGDYGIVSVDSSFYKAFVDGTISTGDFFYPNIVPNGQSIPALEFFTDGLGQSTIKMYTNFDLLPGAGNPDDDEIDSQGDMIFLANAGNNQSVFTLLSSSKVAGSYSKGGVSYTYETTFLVNEAVTTQNLYNVNVTIHDANPDDVVYLKMYTVNGNLFVDFVNSADITTSGAQPINIANNKNILVFSNRNNFKQTLEVEAVLEQNKFLVRADRYGELKIGDYVDAFIDPEFEGVAKGFARIVGKQVYASDPSLSQITTDSAVKFLDFGGDKQTTRYSIVDDYVNNYQGMVLDGFKIRTDSLPNGTETRQNDILNLLAVGTPIYKGLINRNKISWRYLIDPWGLGLTSNSKQQLVDLCGARLNCLGLLNMPSAKSFKNSTSPTFTNADGTLNYSYIRLGGNPESNPAFTYSFGQGSGQTCVAYFFPWVTLLDNGRTILVPPAMFVANTFMRKHNTRRSDVYPWTIAAGLTNGTVTGFGNVEVDIDDDGIAELNDMGANPLIFKINRGFVIETNNTAQAVPKTALSNIHVREVLIELENQLYNMLLTYQWRFNTAEVRAEIKQRADAICAQFVSQNGLYDFYNQIDESNNTTDLIDAGIGVLDTFVEPIQGLGVIVNQITILRTGSIESGGFRSNQ